MIPDRKYQISSFDYHPEHSIILSKKLPQDILIYKIFFRLNFQQFQNLAQVNKELNVLATDPEILKQVIYKIASFNPEDWAFHLGPNPLWSLDSKLAWQMLPDNIGELFKTASLMYPKLKVGEQHVLVWIPKDLSINRYGKLLSQKFSENPISYSYIGYAIAENYGNQLTEKGEWVFMSRKQIPDMKWKMFIDQDKSFKQYDIQGFQSYKVPTLLQAIISVSTSCFKEQIKPFESYYQVRCQECINNWPTIMTFNLKRFVLDGSHIYNYSIIGVGALLKF